MVFFHVVQTLYAKNEIGIQIMNSDVDCQVQAKRTLIDIIILGIE